MWDIYIAGEYGGMNEVLAELYAITGEQRYLDAALFFDHDKIFIPCAENLDRLAGNHANQTIPKITGALRIYDQNKTQKYIDIAANFWHMVTHSHMYIIGGTSEGEMFKEPNRIGEFLTNRTCETCCTYNMLKLTKQLFLHNPLPSYMDYYERALYNHILASQDARSEHGFTTYFIPLEPGSRKRYSNDYRSFSCCHGTGMENHTKYAESIYFHADSILWINLFIPSELDWRDKNITIRQETHFPEEQGTKLQINGKGTFALKIRRPFWATRDFKVAINSAEHSISSEPGSYVTINRTWENGDTVTISMPFDFRVEYTRDIPNIGGIMYGPILLGGENVTSLQSLSLNPSVPSGAFVQDSKNPLHFTLQNISFVPFYKIHGIPYSVYFKIEPLQLSER